MPKSFSVGLVKWCDGIEPCKIESEDDVDFCLKEEMGTSEQRNLFGADEIPYNRTRKHEYIVKCESQEVHTGKRKGKEKIPGTLTYDDQNLEGNSTENCHARCFQCRISFRQDKDYVKHFKERHGNLKPFQCTKCHESYVFKNSLIKHFKYKHDANLPNLRYKRWKALLCEPCNVVFKGWTHFENHAVKNHQGVKMMLCSQCPMKFFKRRDVLRHEKEKHSVQKEFRCTHCRNRFDRTDELKDHEVMCGPRRLKKVIGDKAPDMKVANVANIRNRCDECREEFVSFNVLKDHYKSKHPEIKLFPCDYCDEAFSRKGPLERHLDKRHPKKDFDLEICQRYRRGMLYTCEYCEREFVGVEKYENHGIRDHASLPMFFCRDCGRGFARRDSLRIHANEAHGHVKKKCSYCPKYYYKTFRLLKHEKSCKRIMEKRELLGKEGVPRYHCDVCDKDVYVKNAESVKRHIRWHREYDFCTVCKSGFNRVKNIRGLVKHMKLRHLDSINEKSTVFRSLEEEKFVVKNEEFAVKEEGFILKGDECN